MRELVSRIILGLFSANETSFNGVAAVLMILEACLSHIVILKVKYTEIDWSTYMQQVECYSNKGILNYTEIGGDTGPVVYPAGHIFAYRILHLLTNSGRNIRWAQHIFQGFYLLNVFMVFRILQKTMRIPPIVLFLVTITGYRIHSIFMLRLFNDPLAMLLFYVAMDRFLEEKWLVGCIFYSLAVSIKMNVLLFAPALFFTLILNNSFLHTFGYLSVCAVIQLYVGSPFLLYDWKSYVQRSFDLGRVFMFKWTVNWRFLPEDLFLDKRFHVALLVGHITVLGLFAWYMWFRRLNGLPSSMYIRVFEGIQTKTGALETYYAFCTANFIGIAFSRSLHYQFYSWYFHQLPFLLFCDYPHVRNVSNIPWKQFFWKVPLLLAIELCWNVYPSTWWSSGLLHICHIIIFWHLISTRSDRPMDSVSYRTLGIIGERQEILDDVMKKHGVPIPRPSYSSDIKDDDELSDDEVKERSEQEEEELEEDNSDEEEEEDVEDSDDEEELETIKEYRIEQKRKRDDKWEENFTDQMKRFNREHKIYCTDDGKQQVYGLSPIDKTKKLELNERLQSLYIQSLAFKSKLQRDIENDEESGSDEELEHSEDDQLEQDETQMPTTSQQANEAEVSDVTDESVEEETESEEGGEDGEGEEAEEAEEGGEQQKRKSKESGKDPKYSAEDSALGEEKIQMIFEKLNGIRHRVTDVTEESNGYVMNQE
uniref:dolichyl-P-Man:Man5GlcNAc2-PP-dolichol alpha-1,3-mannosyltransferase n=1 Tax=Caenorhabditis tropicalis TaxID=1561998 RepID=A0A1I7UUL8_9PELO